MSFRYNATTNTIESVESGISLKLVATAAGVRVPVLAVEPVSAVNGEIYYNSVTNLLRVWQGGSWLNYSSDALAVHLAGTETITGNKTFTGIVNMAGSPAVTIPTPTSGNQPTTKTYVDNLVASGTIWKAPITDPDIQDVVSAIPTPVGVAANDTFTYIKFGGVQGETWGAVTGVSDGDILQFLVVTPPSTGTWMVVERGPLLAGRRLGLAFEHGTVAPTAALYTAGFRHGDLVQYVSGNPTLFASWTLPSDGGYQAINFNTPKAAGDSTGIPNNATVYHLNVSVNGVVHDISVTGSAIQTFGTLASQLSTALNVAYPGASAVLDADGNIHIFSGDLTKVIISDGSPNPLLFNLGVNFDEIRAGIINGTTVLVSDAQSLHFGHTYFFPEGTNHWIEIAGPGVAAPGADTDIIFNDGGALGANANLTYDQATGQLFVNTTDGTTGSVVVGGTAGSISVISGRGGFQSGNVLIKANDSGRQGGNVTIKAGISSQSTTGFQGGSISILAGDSVTGSFNLDKGGDVTIAAGGHTSLSGADGGAVLVRGGDSGGQGGDVTVQAGQGSAVRAGNVIITAGAATIQGVNGGSVSIAATNANGTGGDPNKNGGNVTITTGAATGTGTPGTIGHVTAGGHEYQRSGNFATPGDAQSNMYVLRVQTTDNTQTELFLDGTGGTQRLVLPNDTTWKFEVHIVARRTDADNEGSAFKVEGAIDRNTNAASTATIGSVTPTTVADDSAGAWTVLVDADTTNGSLRVQVTGENTKTIRWVAFVRTVETTG